MKFITFIFFALLAVGVGLYFGEEIRNGFMDLRDSVSAITPFTADTEVAEEATGEISAPAPLVKKETAPPPKEPLTASGVFMYTNLRRTENGLPALNANASLRA